MMSSIISGCHRLGWVVLFMVSFVGIALPAALDDWTEGLGQSPNAIHSFLFEVTFMNIDVAIVEYRLDESTAAEVSSITAEGEMNDDLKDRVANALLAAETIAFSMNLQRDIGSGKLLKAMRINLERALESELISVEEHDLVSERLGELFAFDDERGVLEGDRLMYRVEPDGVKVYLLGVEGNMLIDSLEPGPAWTKGIKGIFLGPDSKLRDKLVGAAWDNK